MPIYEYDCESCGKKVEVLLRSSREKPVCPSCGSRKLTRLLSTFAAHMGGESCPAANACPASGGGCPGRGSCPMS